MIYDYSSLKYEELRNKKLEDLNAELKIKQEEYKKKMKNPLFIFKMFLRRILSSIRNKSLTILKLCLLYSDIKRMIKI